MKWLGKYFRERNSNSSETEKQQHLQEIKKLTDKVKELNKNLEDKQSSIEAKRVVIWNLEEKVKELEGENMELKCKLDRSKHKLSLTTLQASVLVISCFEIYYTCIYYLIPRLSSCL